MAGVRSSFPSERPARLWSLSESNSGPISRALPPNTLTSSYYFRHSNKHAETRPNSLGHRFSGTAYGFGVRSRPIAVSGLIEAADGVKCLSERGCAAAVEILF